VRQVIMLVVAFSPLVESVSGFGIAIIVVAPILVALGFDRFKATLLALVGLSAVPWGALATGTVIGANLSGIPLQKLGSGSAELAIPTFLYFAVVAVYLAGGWNAIKAKWLEILAVSSSLSGSIWLFSTYVSVELAGVLGAIVALTVEFLFIRTTLRLAKKENQVNIAEIGGSSSDNMYGILKAMSPYLFLTGILFLTRLITAISKYLTSHFVFQLSDYSFRLPLLYSPGFCLLLTCLFSIWMFKIGSLVIVKSIQCTLMQWMPVTLSTTAFVAMSEVMSSAGMTTVLANAAVFIFGSSLILISPLIGGMGGFLTGSNTGANAMFIKLQVQASVQLGLSPDPFAYAQNTSASHMTMASPSRVLLGLSVCNIPEEENRLLRQIFLIAIGAMAILIVGVLTVK
jgi:lactate permease